MTPPPPNTHAHTHVHSHTHMHNLLLKTRPFGVFQSKAAPGHDRTIINYTEPKTRAYSHSADNNDAIDITHILSEMAMAIGLST